MTPQSRMTDLEREATNLDAIIRELHNEWLLLDAQVVEAMKKAEKVRELLDERKAERMAIDNMKIKLAWEVGRNEIGA